MAQRVRGEGSVYWAESQDRYIASFMIGRDATGKIKRKVFCGPRGDKSRAAKLGVVSRLDAFAARAPKNVPQRTIADCVERYTRNPALRTNTRAWYASLYRTHIAGTTFASKRLTDIGRKDVSRFLEGLDVGVTTRRGVQALLHRVFEVAIEDEDLMLNPASKIRKPRAERPKTVAWEPDETLAFLNLDVVRAHRAYALFLLSLTTTMGPAELFGLQRSSVSLRGRYLVVEHNLVEVNGRPLLEPPKNDFRRRRIDLPAFTVDALRRHLERQLGAGHGASPFVFTGPEGGPIVRTNFMRREWKPLLEAANLELEREAKKRGERPIQLKLLTMYGLRHTANALMGYLGVPIEVARERMGHASIMQTSDTYGHLFESMQKGVAVKLDDFLAGAKPA
jgi:integrase